MAAVGDEGESSIGIESLGQHGGFGHDEVFSAVHDQGRAVDVAQVVLNDHILFDDLQRFGQSRRAVVAVGFTMVA